MTDTIGLTKLAVAQREINAAVRILFDGGDPVAICVLASAARGIVTTLCEAQGVRSFFDDLQEEFPTHEKRDLYKEANKHANFFKHADNDPDAVLNGFQPSDADVILFTATYDFGSICKGKSIEAQVFEAWFLYLYGVVEDVPSGLDDLFPKLRELPRSEQLALGKKVLSWALTQRDFQMTYSLETPLMKDRQ
jgi:hypothetical protein